jgi:hypothetical protein
VQFEAFASIVRQGFETVFRYKIHNIINIHKNARINPKKYVHIKINVARIIEVFIITWIPLTSCSCTLNDRKVLTTKMQNKCPKICVHVKINVIRIIDV